MNLLINIVYYVDSYIHIYIPNQAIRVAQLCFFFKIYWITYLRRSRDLDSALELKFLRNHTYTCPLLACKIVK